MMRLRRDQKGFTLVELLVTIMIAGIVLAVGVYNFMGDLPNYRLRAAARRVGVSLNLLKMKAVSTNRNTWFFVDLANNAFTGFVDLNANNAGDVPGEYLGSGLEVPETVGGVPVYRLPPGVTFGLPADYTSGAGPDNSAFPSDPVSTLDNHIGFRPTGLPMQTLGGNANPNGPMVVYLTNSTGRGYAVSIQITGRIRVFQWTRGAWR